MAEGCRTSSSARQAVDRAFDDVDSEGDLSMRQCTRCRQAKSEGDFYATSKSWCKECRREYARQRHAGLRDATTTKPCAVCGSPIEGTEMALMRRRFCSRQCHRRHYNTVGRYGVADGEKADMLRRQGGRCAVCRRSNARRWCVDHDHRTGKVRGVLCSACNTGLGQLRDDPGVLRAAADYVESALPDRWQVLLSACARLREETAA